MIRIATALSRLATTSCNSRASRTRSSCAADRASNSRSRSACAARAVANWSRPRTANAATHPPSPPTAATRIRSVPSAICPKTTTHTAACAIVGNSLGSGSSTNPVHAITVPTAPSGPSPRPHALNATIASTFWSM